MEPRERGRREEEEEEEEEERWSNFKKGEMLKTERIVILSKSPCGDYIDLRTCEAASK